MQQVLERPPTPRYGLCVCQLAPHLLEAGVLGRYRSVDVLRRLHRVQFVWPAVDAASGQISAEQWQWLIIGVDWQRLLAPAPAQRIYSDVNYRGCKRRAWPCKPRCMNLLYELARTDLDPALLAKIHALVTQQQVKLDENDFKIKAPKFELAYYKRERFSMAKRSPVWRIAPAV